MHIPKPLHTGGPLLGLDQYAYSIAAEYLKDQPDTDFVLGDPDRGKQLKFAQWRKHPALEGYMERLYRSKGGKQDIFNCCSVRITLDDLDDLEIHVVDQTLPYTKGFFFGSDQPEDRHQDFTFIQDARRLLQEGKAVWYRSLW